jgi:hypothetical protein
VWNEVKAAKPDFHLPEYFGKIRFLYVWLCGLSKGKIAGRLEKYGSLLYGKYLTGEGLLLFFTIFGYVHVKTSAGVDGHRRLWE